MKVSRDPTVRRPTLYEGLGNMGSSDEGPEDPKYEVKNTRTCEIEDSALGRYTVI